MAIGPSEAEPFWSGFLRSLTRRGLRGVKLVISDAHEGLKAAAAKVPEGSTVERVLPCQAPEGNGQRLGLNRREGPDIRGHRGMRLKPARAELHCATGFQCLSPWLRPDPTF